MDSPLPLRHLRPLGRLKNTRQQIQTQNSCAVVLVLPLLLLRTQSCVFKTSQDVTCLRLFGNSFPSYRIRSQSASSGRSASSLKLSLLVCSRFIVVALLQLVFRGVTVWFRGGSGSSCSSASPFAWKVARARVLSRLYTHTLCEFGCGAMESLNPFCDCYPALPFSRVAARLP